MLTLASPKRMRRRILAVALPVCMGLALAGLSPSMLTPARAQLPQRIKAPELDGAVGTLGADKPIRLKDLRGKIVVIEFWTLC